MAKLNIVQLPNAALPLASDDKLIVSRDGVIANQVLVQSVGEFANTQFVIPAVAVETANRVAADTAEMNERVSGDLTNANAITAETNARIAADQLIRDDLASTTTGKGSSLVGFKRESSGSVARTAFDKLREYVSAADYGKSGGDTIANLVGITPTVNNVYYNSVSYYNGYTTPSGGGLFVWSSTTPKSQHNGGTVISPTVPWSGLTADLAAFLAGTGETNPTGNGCWLRVFDGPVKAAWFGADGGGSYETVSIDKAVALSPFFSSPKIYNSTAANPVQLFGRQFGFGQIKTADNNKTAPFFSNINQPPTSLGDETSILTAFNGDLSRCQFPVSHYVTGTTTLGNPTTGYKYTPEAIPHYTYLLNSSGHNESLSSNVGRTGIAAYRTKVFHNGQGDAVCYNGSVFVTGTKTGSTSFLANPAGVFFNGDMLGGQDGVYLNPYETILDDGGFDVAAVGVVNNFKRTISTGAKSAIWLGYRAQSVGTATCDAIISATGKWVTGLDLSMSTLDFGTQKAAISLKANDRIYFNNNANASGNLAAGWRTTGFNGDYLQFNSSNSVIQFVRAGSSKFEISTSQVTVANAIFGVNPSPGTTRTALIRGVQTGFALPTGTSNTGTFDTATVTTERLAQYVKGLVERLHESIGGHALIGV